jgi:hypothetical protein
MSYINTTTGAYPLSADDIRAAFPNTSFPDTATGFETAIQREGYKKVAQTPQPSVDYTEDVTEGAPEEQDGSYVQTWVVTDASTAEIQQRTDAQAEQVRVERNERLAACDWTQLTDSPLSAEAKAAWAFYRENLRMVPEQPGFPWNVQWPPTPSAN